MCGFVGIFGADRLGEKEIARGERALGLLKHRGPDGVRSLKHDCAWLGHARLSVIDLDGGWQPMQDSETKNTLIFNGEIYNFKELKTELESLGVKFHSKSDSEVILQGVQRFGESFIAKLNGIFSFVFYNHQEQEVIFARDPLGTKPLYYQESHNTIYFSSELRPLAVSQQERPTPNIEALFEYLAIGYTLAPLTVVKNIFQVPHGALGKWRKGNLTLARYSDFKELLEIGPKKSKKEEFTELFEAAIKRQMISDIPVGVALSGGIDSSLIASAASKVSGSKLQMFTVDFQESGYSELSAAKEVAKHLGAEHHSFKFTFPENEEACEVLFWQSDAPIFDNSFFPSHFLYKNVKPKCSVLLAGDGGDEIFLGYETYKADIIANRLTRVPKALSSPIRGAVRKLVPLKPGKVTLSYKIRAFTEKLFRQAGEAHCGWRELLPDDIALQVIKEKFWQDWNAFHPMRKFQKIFDSTSKRADLLNRMSYLDVETWLANDILVKSDRASMASGVEVRVPLLDLELVRFGLRLSQKDKFTLRESKKILRRELNKNIPEYKIGPKRGFNSPASEWLAKMIRRNERFSVLSPQGPFREILDEEAIDKLQEMHSRQESDYGYFLWALMSLDRWWKQLEKARANAA